MILNNTDSIGGTCNTNGSQPNLFIRILMVIFRVGFDVGFFYTLIPLAWRIESEFYANSSLFIPFLVAMTLYHCFNDLLKICLIVVILLINIGLMITLYLYPSVETIFGELLFSALAAILGILSFAMDRFIAIQEGQTSSIPVSHHLHNGRNIE